jgi:hypothetical protein
MRSGLTFWYARECARASDRNNRACCKKSGCCFLECVHLTEEMQCRLDLMSKARD